jgi:hypothetical protein
MEKIYISGKITGLTLTEASSNFKQAEVVVSKLYPEAEIINPLTATNLSKYKTWEEYMVEDLALVRSCSTICLLENHNYSKGATLELAEARRCNLNIKFLRVLKRLIPKKP